MEKFSRDIRYALRMFSKRPFFTAIAVLTLALGIGANTAIFSVVNAVLLSPLPYEESDRLMGVWENQASRGRREQPVAISNFIDWKEQNQSFELMAAVRSATFNLTDGGEPERIDGIRVSVEILRVLRIEPALGRGFTDAEGRPGGEMVALLSHALWQRRYGSNADIIGRKITLDQRPFTVIGVLPAGVRHPGLNFPETGADIWIPAVPQQGELPRGFHAFRVIGRLRAGATIEAAQAEFDAIAERLQQQYPNSNTGWVIGITPLREQIVGRIRTPLLVLLGAVVFVLLIACANVANLLLAQATARRQELAIRTAFGASRSRLVRQMLTESLMLSFAGGVIGLALAVWGVPVLTSIDANRIPRMEEIGVDARVLAFTLAVSIVTSLLFGLVPALRSSSNRFIEALREGRKGAGGAAHHRTLNLLVVVEVALAMVLLICAGLMIRSFLSVKEVDPGFDPRGLLTLSVNLPTSSYKDQRQQEIFYRRFIDGLSAIAGVEKAAAISRLPVVGFATANFTLEGKPVPAGTEPSADYRAVTPEYFQTIGIPLISGRDFTSQDTERSSDVIVINEAMRDQFFEGENPIGKRIQLAAERTRFREIVGVVGDAKLGSLDSATTPAVYVPFPQSTWPDAFRQGFLVVRGKNPESLVSAIRSELKNIDAEIPLSQVRTMEQIISSSLSQRRFNTSLLAVFAALAGLLAAVGIYGVMAFSVSQRTHEIGVRMALGAEHRDVMKMVLGQGALLAAAGAAAGVVGAFALTRVLSTLLFGVTATDPVTFALIPLTVIATAVAACYVPARRATRVDPVIALRQ
jgi:putative ABC transport system permease protein